MPRRRRTPALVATLGAVAVAAHALAGAAGVMTVAQWSSGAAIGLGLLLLGGFWMMHAR